MDVELIVVRLTGSSMYDLLLFCILSMMRPMGLLFGFIGIAWALGSSASIIRTVVAIAISIPIVVFEIDTFKLLIDRMEPFHLVVISIKEIVIGLIIGLLASIPFRIVEFGGALMDAYRGEGASGAQSPAGDDIATNAKFNVVVALLLFVSIGGLWQLFLDLYKSYKFWPIGKYLPQITEDMPVQILSLLNHITLQALVVASPFLFLLISIDFILLVSGKVAKGLNVMDMSFGFKNVTALILLPIYVVVYIYALKTIYFRDLSFVDQLQRLIK